VNENLSLNLKIFCNRNAVMLSGIPMNNHKWMIHVYSSTVVICDKYLNPKTKVRLPDLLQELQLRDICSKCCGITVHVGRYILLLLAVIHKHPGSAPYIISTLRCSITTRTSKSGNLT
jgi:hypothetical protein